MDGSALKKHHGSSQFSFIAFETELQCHGVVPSTYLLKRHGFSRFCHHPDGISALYDSFFPSIWWSNTDSRPGWLHWTWKWIVSLAFSLSRFLLMFCLLRYQKFYKTSNPNSEETHTRINPPYLFLSRTIFTSLLVTLLTQQGVIFFQHPRAVIKTLLWMKLLPTEMGIIILLLHCYYYLLCDLLLRWWSDHFQKVIGCWCLFQQLRRSKNTKNKLSSQLEQKSHLIELNPLFWNPYLFTFKNSQPENRPALNALNPPKNHQWLPCSEALSASPVDPPPSKKTWVV